MGIGQLVDIGGTDLYYEYVGESNDGPTIVFESGYGWSLDKWNPIREEISKFARMFMYDREGVGRSGNSDRPKHSLQIIENLRNLLKKADIKPPYILVGHSFGGINVRLYASRYPAEVKGIILLDSAHEDQNKKMVPLFTKDIQQVYLGQFVVEASLDEFEESLEQVRGTTLKNIPLIVMTGGTQQHHTQESMAAWMDFQKELKNLSTKSKHIIVKEAGHAIHHDSPNIVIDAIKEMVCSIDSRN
ncbi:alpha/beta fold hydrolase [Pseudalkalibacillus salsuginis]|uniref:alpha/beta fold hydrolase n=1 Tax=Pseudalkalibacillus salsuginis TaxID=2910972 RepID=UPI001F1D981B|nr:alpha/beta hydrolase [Pseudalkalibacillus salsuginis]MCF6409867.1 alpha/beta hydrolase [Pseudalkalibacillus salsuginis]